MPGICVNEDNAHFYANHPESDMTREGCRALVDWYAQFPEVAALMFCVNVQRALFNSRSWERLYDGYDPDAGPDQPVLRWLTDPLDRELTLGSQGRYWIHNLRLLEQNGVDHPAVWLERCRERGIEGWLTMRMNDVHYNDNPQAFWHSTLWRERPDLWLTPREDTSYWSYRGFDYRHPEVRAHHLNLLRELLERYDLFGIELDWIRTPPHFSPGYEEEGRSLLLEFTAEVRDLAHQAARRLGHPVQVGARVPTRPESGRLLGLDGIAWAREGLVDQLVLSSYLSVIEFDMPIRAWKEALGDLPVTLVAQFSTSCYPFPEATRHGLEGLSLGPPEILRGAAANALSQGADRVYLFNHCYAESEFTQRATFSRTLATLGSLPALAGNSRRHALSFPEITHADEPRMAVLPVEVVPGEAARLELRVAPEPDMTWAALVLGFDRGEPSPLPQDLEVRVNGAACRYWSLPRHSFQIPAIANPCLAFSIPAGTLQAGLNQVQVTSTAPGRILWCEVHLA